jgi:hypothetical protein
MKTRVPCSPVFSLVFLIPAAEVKGPSLLQPPGPSRLRPSRTRRQGIGILAPISPRLARVGSGAFPRCLLP